MDFLLNFLGAIVGLFLGGYLLLYGRRALWATAGIIGLAATANVLAVLVAGVDSGWDLIDLRAWALLGIALAVGVVGLILGRAAPKLAVQLIGFVAGADVMLWFYDILAYIITDLARLSEQFVFWIALVLIIVGGLGGLWFVRNYRDEGLILISMVVGTEMIVLGMGLDTNSSWTAVVALSLALFSVIYQYAAYQRELNPDGSQGLGEYRPPPTELAP